WWCQGFSEPNAGSDLVSLRTSASRCDDHYIVSGQKIWSSHAQHADWMFALVRTDLHAKPHQGISLILIDMRSPGVAVRPIRLIDGGSEVSEVSFDNVEVPLNNLVGAENHGWDYAKYLLRRERSCIAGIGVAKAMLARVKELARSTVGPAGSLWSQLDFRIR